MTLKVPARPDLAAASGATGGRSQRRSDAGRVLAVFVAFGAFATLAWLSYGPTSGPAFFYPSAGVTAAAFMLSRRALWPAIAAAIVAAELVVDTLFGNPLPLSVAFAVSNVAEPLVGASLTLFCCGGRPDLSKRRDFFAFIGGACLGGPAVGGLIGGTSSSVVNGFPWFSTALSWASGDAVGVLVVASPILLWAAQSHVVRRRPWETLGVLVLTAAISGATFWTAAPPSMLVLPVLAWAAFRLDMLGAALAGAVAAFLGNLMTSHGHGLFAPYDVSPGAQIALTQAFVATIVVVAMLIAQEAGARLRAVREKEAEYRERMRLESLSRLAHQLSGALTLKEIGQALEKQLLNEAGATALSFGVLAPGREALRWVTLSGYPPAVREEFGVDLPLSANTVATDAVRSGRPILIRSARQYAAEYGDEKGWLARSGSEAMAGWPLTSAGEPIGVLVLVWADPQLLDSAQQAFISAAATMVSQTLMRAKVFADERARARVLHSAAHPVARVKATQLDYRALYQPAELAAGLGGDWFSVMALPGERTYLSVGDVIGHGLTAVEDMAQLRSTGNAYAHQGLSPARILAELNRFAASQIRGEFATNSVAIFDPETATLSYSSAGHLPPLLRRAANGEVSQLSDAQGPLLGPLAEAPYTERTVPVGCGDVLVMYTDGLVEHENHDLTAGIERLEQVVAAWSPEALLDCEALAEELAPSPRDDDLCLLVIRFGATDSGATD